MKPLETTFRRGDGGGAEPWLHEQIARDGDVALYRRSRNGAQEHFEVIVVQKSKGGEAKMGGVDVVFEPKERYPSAEDWGTFGWTYTTFDLAWEKLMAVKAAREMEERASGVVRG